MEFGRSTSYQNENDENGALTGFTEDQLTDSGSRVTASGIADLQTSTVEGTVFSISFAAAIIWLGFFPKRVWLRHICSIGPLPTTERLI
jgi:hypothetical protein